MKAPARVDGKRRADESAGGGKSTGEGGRGPIGRLLLNNLELALLQHARM